MNTPTPPYPWAAAAAILSLLPAMIRAEPVTSVFQQGLQEYAGTVDMRLRVNDDQPGSSTGAIAVDGGSSMLGDAAYALGYVRFDQIFGNGPAGIPQGAHILSARLDLTTNIATDAQSGGSFLISVLNLPLPVPETGTTFSAFSNASGFGGPDFVDGHTQRPLGAFRSTDEPRQRLDQGELCSVDVTEAVQAWANATPEEPLNHGFVITPANGTDAWAFASSSNGTPSARPRLVVTWLPPAEAATLGAKSRGFQQGRYDSSADTTYEGTVSAWLRDNVTNPANSSLDGNQQANPQYLDGPATGSPDDQMLIQFNDLFGDQPGQIALKPTLQIQRAVLRLTTNTASSANAVSPGPADVHRMLVPWYTVDSAGALSFRNFTDFKSPSAPPETMGDGPTPADGEIGPVLDSRYGMYHYTSNGFDVTEAVRAWAAGEPNYGLNVQMSTGDGWQIYFPGASLQDGRPELVITWQYAIDTDNDGLPDPWETLNGTTIGTADQDADSDGDTLTNLQEYRLGTAANLADSDADGLRDEVENRTGTWLNAASTGTSPTTADSDGDGLVDGVENPQLVFTGLQQPGSNPNLADTDADGFPDRTEVLFQSSPVLAEATPALPWQTTLADDFDSPPVGSVFNGISNGGSFFPGVADSLSPIYLNALQITSNETTGTNSNNAVAWDLTPTGGDAVRMTFDLRMSADPAASEAGDGFGIGWFASSVYGTTDPVNPGLIPRQWEDPRNGGGFPSALVLGFDLYNGATEGNNIRITGPASPGTALANVIAPFPLNNGQFHRFVLTTYAAGDGSILRLEAIEDVAGTAVPRVLIPGLSVPGWNTSGGDFRLIAGGRTGGAVVATFLDNVQLAKATASANPDPVLPAFRILETRISAAPPAITLTWESTNGGTYQIESSANLSAWQSVDAPFTAVSDRTEWTGTLSSPARYWRIRRTR